ncbi:melibiose:sodium transporter MelB [Spirochaetia bacterium]|nr:melibiose:sodium transporter MelB [Spirochaetia bacterium]
MGITIVDYKRNRWTYGLGAIGRDYVYSLVSTFLIFYITDIIKVSTGALWWVSAIIICVRFIALPRDPILGMIVDNTRSKYGRFKPWLAIGTVATGIFTVLLFTDFHVSEGMFIVIFALLYLLWDTCYSINDVAYLALMPTLSLDQKEREKITSMQRICAYFGSYMLMVLIIPLTTLWSKSTGSLQRAWFFLAVAAAVGMFISQCVTVFGVKEFGTINTSEKKTKIKELFWIIVKNDQLLYMAVVAILFNIGSITTTGLGLYYFKYIYGDESMYSVFSIAVGISQIIVLIFLPVLRKVFSRPVLYICYIIVLMIGYIMFFFAPTTTLLYISIAGVLIFSGTVSALLIVWMFLVDSIDYGHWKLKKRNDSVTVSVFSFLNKMGSSLANAIIGFVIIISGIKNINTATQLTPNGILIIKLAMTAFPALCIIVGYIIYLKKYKIDDKMHAEILKELQQRGDIK